MTVPGDRVVLVPTANKGEYLAFGPGTPRLGGQCLLVPTGNSDGSYYAVAPGSPGVGDSAALVPIGNQRSYVPIAYAPPVAGWITIPIGSGTVTPWDAYDPNFLWCTSIPEYTPWTSFRVGYSSGPQCVNGVTVWSYWPPRTPDPAVGYFHRHMISNEWHFEHSGSTAKTTYVGFQYAFPSPPIGIKQFRFIIDGNTLGQSRWTWKIYTNGNYYECALNYGDDAELYSASTYDDHVVIIDHRPYGLPLPPTMSTHLFNFLTTVPAGGGTMDLTIRAIQYQLY